jgi:hypothetical protein
MVFPLNPAAGQNYTNPANRRTYQWTDCGNGHGYWGLVQTQAAAGTGPDIDDWNALNTYSTGDIVLHDNALFRALTNSTGVTPSWPTDSTEWKVLGQVPHISNNPAPDLQPGSVMMWDGNQWIIKPATAEIVTEVGDFNSDQGLVTRANTPRIDVDQYVYGRARYQTHIGAAAYPYGDWGLMVYFANTSQPARISVTRAYNSFEAGGVWARSGDKDYYSNTPNNDPVVAGQGVVWKSFFSSTDANTHYDIEPNSAEFCDLTWNYHNDRLTCFFDWYFEGNHSKGGLGKFVQGAMTVLTNPANPVVGLSLMEPTNAGRRSWVRLKVQPD